MKDKRRKPTHPGIILDEDYIKPLNLNLQELANHLGISRNTLFKIRNEKLGITPSLAIRLAEAFDTTPNLWLNLQQQYDLWIEGNERVHKPVSPLFHTNPRLKPKRRKSKVPF